MAAGTPELLAELKGAYEANPCDIELCKKLLAQLKGAMAGEEEMRMDGRECMEIGCLVSVRNRDAEAFERHYGQLSCFYTDCRQIMPDSSREALIVGLWLLHLLACSRIGEFHMALERIPPTAVQDPLIKYVVGLDRHLMNGNYRKIFHDQPPTPVFSHMMVTLLDTCRRKIAHCMEAAYASIDTAFACELLFLNGIQELREFVSKENTRKMEEGDALCQWQLTNRLEFLKADPPKDAIPAIELLHHTVGYATELERIV
eukprot:GHVS01074931.1.p1 GENE.GHVS01074931.1~~GHVS01074931.1.p1  ORF type:complete len:259 (-),score=35.06 GHVS01074931.1:236-1012(-)